jgi:mono/diheme cytochrome c family protein
MCLQTLVLLLGCFGVSLSVSADEASVSSSTFSEVSTEQSAAGLQAFRDVYRVLMHPRCLNCHPSGDAPLQYDDSRPHAMNVTRASAEAGLQCATCHQTQNSEAYGVKGGPPGAPNWHLPEAEMPLVFEGRSVVELCKQLKDPSQNGHKTLEQLYAHVAYDPLVLWGWDPGGERNTPPLEHAEFIQQFRVWVDAGGPCVATTPSSTESMHTVPQ